MSHVYMYIYIYIYIRMYIYMYVCMWVFPSLGRLFFFCLTILLVVVIILIIIIIEIVINEYNDFCRYLYFYNNCCYYSFSSSLSTSLPVCRVSQASAGRRRWRGLSTPFSLPSLPPPSSAGTHSSPRNVKGGQCQFLPSLHPLLYFPPPFSSAIPPSPSPLPHFLRHNHFLLQLLFLVLLLLIRG